ncbi:MAG: hypothetical protein AVDCRST_MAG11-1233, partial [uncultured Gemmatimonadaceae bacterium]
ATAPGGDQPDAFAPRPRPRLARRAARPRRVARQRAPRPRTAAAVVSSTPRRVARPRHRPPRHPHQKRPKIRTTRITVSTPATNPTIIMAVVLERFGGRPGFVIDHIAGL